MMMMRHNDKNKYRYTRQFMLQSYNLLQNLNKVVCKNASSFAMLLVFYSHISVTCRMDDYIDDTQRSSAHFCMQYSQKTFPLSHKVGKKGLQKNSKER